MAHYENTTTTLILLLTKKKQADNKLKILGFGIYIYRSEASLQVCHKSKAEEGYWRITAFVIDSLFQGKEEVCPCY